VSFISSRDHSDPDERRKEILWTAICFVVILASWLAVVLVFGYQPLALGMTYDEAVLVIGLGLLLFCSILYLIGKEREQRYTNRRLVTELQTTVSALDERVHQLNGLCAISAELAGMLDVDSISQEIVDRLLDTLQGARAFFILVDPRRGNAVYGRRSRDGDRSHEPGPTDGEGIWPGPVAPGQGRLTDVEAQVDEWNRQPNLVCTSFGCANGLVGILAARRGMQDRAFTADDRSILTTLGNMASKALESAHLHAELRENYLATVRSLVLSLDARDNYAATHGQRVTSLAIRMAERMGLPESATRDIEVFAPLHDVGKIGIRDDVLMKEGPLTDDERETCRTHCLIGDRIVRPLKPGRDALSLIRSHHESWDGRGYPDGLRGEAIPLLARIVKVADCYDALVSERPYGAVMSEQEALAHFRMHAGAQYDPAVVDVFAAVLREGEDESGAPTRSVEPVTEPAAAIAAGSV
jgi:HD-GYP domain-containing protein (c-di-GMP phosphodiesterase class II)